MIGFEFRKLFQKTSTKVLLAALLTINILLAWNMDAPGTDYNFDTAQIRTLYAALPEDGALALSALRLQRDKMEDAVWEDSFDGQLLSQDIYAELSLFASVIDRIAPVVEYCDYLAEVDAGAQALLMSGLFEDTGTFGYQNIVISREKFQALASVKPQIFYSGALEMLPNQRMTDIFVVLLCMLLALEMITGERMAGTLALVKPAKRGREPLLRTKLVTYAVALFIGVILLYGSNLAVGIIRCGGFPLSAPVQSIYGFQRSAWRISVGMYLALFICMKYLWSISLGSIVILMCLLADGVISACSLSVVALLPSLLVARSTGFFGSCSLVNTADTATMFSVYRNLNIFGRPVSSFAVSVAAMLTVMVICVLLSFWIHRKRAPIPKSRRRKRRSGTIHISTGLFRHESYKLLIMNGGMWILLALAVVQLFSYYDFTAHICPDETRYIQYSSVLSGKPNGKKDAYLKQEARYFAELQEKLEVYGNAYAAGELDWNTYETLTSWVGQQMFWQEVFERANSQYTLVKEQQVDYVCLTGYNRLLGNEGKRDILVQTLKLFAALILGLSASFSVETETGMNSLLNTTIRKKRSGRYKGILAVLFAIAAAVAAYLPQIISIGMTYGLPGLLAAAGSVPDLGIGFGTVLSALCIYGLGGIVLASAGATIILCVSKRTGSTVQTILFSAVFLFVPVVIGLFILA